MALENILTQNGSSDLFPRSDTHVASVLVAPASTTKNAAAALEISSTTQGFRLPVMTAAQRDAISSPPAGLMVFTTTAGPGTDATLKICVYTGSAWRVVTAT
jgi:hypothetical protein